MTHFTEQIRQQGLDREQTLKVAAFNRQAGLDQLNRQGELEQQRFARDRMTTLADERAEQERLYQKPDGSRLTRDEAKAVFNRLQAEQGSRLTPSREIDLEILQLLKLYPELAGEETEEITARPSVDDVLNSSVYQ
jgi:hypothetical protein